MNEKPLHVRVAEALGDGPCRYEERHCHVGQTVCLRCSGMGDFPRVTDSPQIVGRWLQPYWIEDEDVGEPVPAYDKSWDATGPLIDRYGISLNRAFGSERYIASLAVDKSPEGAFLLDGDMALVAVCNLVLAL